MQGSGLFFCLQNSQGAIRIRRHTVYISFERNSATLLFLFRHSAHRKVPALPYRLFPCSCFTRSTRRLHRQSRDLVPMYFPGCLTVLGRSIAGLDSIPMVLKSSEMGPSTSTSTPKGFKIGLSPTCSLWK